MVQPEEQARLYRPRPELLPAAHVTSLPDYRRLYRRSVEEPQEFWGDIAKEFYWKQQHSGPFLRYNFDVTKGEIFVEWMKGAKTNICYNLLDRNVGEKKLGDKVAFYWEGNEPGDSMKITYGELLRKVCQFANVLRNHGVKKGDRISIYLPMILELVIAMLACARIGAIHSVVFAGFSADSLCERILDCGCSLLITADAFYRGDKLVNLKQIADEALQKSKDKGFPLKKCIVVKHLGREESADGACSQSPPLKRLCQDVQGAMSFLCYSCSSGNRREKQKEKKSESSQRLHPKIPWDPHVDVWWQDLMNGASTECEPEWCDSEDELFILYTSGSTGKPKGVLHTVGGYMLYAATTFKYVFDYQPEDIYWCTADIGWITGHSYITYGPLANGATSILFEGIPTYPDAERMWSIIDKYKVTKFYTAPTAIRLLMKSGEEPVKKHSRKSLKVLGTVGEPINPEAWLWFYRVVGEERCPIVDTFWQTETGGHMLTPLPAATPMKPGSATFPFFGVVPAIMNESGEELEGEAEGYLVFKQPWPGIMRTLYGNHQRFETTYFKKFPGYYVTGCRRDKDGYYWITGRIDDMLNVSVREKIGPIATPDYIQYAPSLPKTRSGKITRRILRKIAQNDRDLGDISTLVNPGIINQLFNNRCNTKL
ncbi:acetyl-coenzyme A synthetase, cytoplasmic isoform X7 [Coturnix japonica]|uniref:acetyl-coenzyme A synthetase, cytoplasmic isoform X7 n=1 Tax=Coturnix japonica TaxID=93934 RepID=UPI000777BC61|nr:acetyl-coenzyme A synthetase, cytoplasmic isoform X7 [Coturnix japonica]